MIRKTAVKNRCVIWVGLLCNIFANIFVIQMAIAQMRWNPDDWPNTEFNMTSVDLGEILGGGPPKDGIPAVDSPNFHSVEDASKWIEPLEPVIAVTLNGQAKAYPLQILTYHEIVNDDIDETPIAVTFCPLCNASMVFNRNLKGEVLDFGTTGLLRMSDLVMYDRQTESWWQQFSGTAIVGIYLDSELERIPSSIVSFQSFQNAFPGGRVLNRETGHSRPYGRNPYPGYDDINQRPFLFRGEIDDRLPPMERVLSVTVDQTNKIYPLSEFEGTALINDSVNSIPVVIFSTGNVLSALDNSRIADSKTLPQVTVWNRLIDGYAEGLNFRIENHEILDDQTQSTWDIFGKATTGPLKDTQLAAVDSGVHFAFAWLAFNSESEIYRSVSN